MPNPAAPVLSRRVPRDLSLVLCHKQWNKELRPTLSVEDKIAFEQKAGGYVLGKHNKLQVFSREINDKNILKHVLNLHQQLKQLRRHAEAYDINDVFEIVIPLYGTAIGPAIDNTICNLFEHYPKLELQMTANSIRHVMSYSNPCTVENMTCAYQLVKNNTEEHLFQKALEEYEKFPPECQGGPLILHIVVKKIQNTSDQWIDCLTRKVETIKITDYKGEDVDHVVSLMRAIENVFVSASTEYDRKLPNDWPKKLLKIFQTSSVEDFNDIFSDLMKKAQQKADMFGGTPKYPEPEHVLRLASQTYDRMKSDDSWDVSKYARRRANAGIVRQLEVDYHGDKGDGPPTPPPARGLLTAPPQVPAQNPGIDCWNCNEPGHTVNDCPKPLNQAKIDKKVKEHRRRKDALKPRGNRPMRPFRPNLRPRPSKRVGRPPRPPQGGARGFLAQDPQDHTPRNPKKKSARKKRARRGQVQALLSQLQADADADRAQESIDAPIHELQDMLRNLL